MAKKKNKSKIADLRVLMVRSKYWMIAQDIDDVLKFHSESIQIKLEKGQTPSEIMAKWPNW